MITPVLLIIFNRPAPTQQIFNAIRQSRPQQLFVVADGPRADKEGEKEKCDQTRHIIQQVDWECELHTLFRDQNMGCGFGVAAAISWFFEHVEEGIILEDDCLPHPDFFPFCTELLDYYRRQTQIMIVSGNNFQYGRKRGNASYYFSKWTHTWGWASWRRAWKFYDHTLLSSERQSHIWDTQWMFSVRKAGGLTILPNVNLISNIGFGYDATHTHNEHSRDAAIPTKHIAFPLVHPPKISQHILADRFTYYHHFGRTWKKEIKCLLPFIIPWMKKRQFFYL